MGSIRSSLLGSFAATTLVAALTLEKNALGIIPEFTMARAWSEIIGMPNDVGVGWLIHLFAGAIVCGIAFELLYSVLPGRSGEVKGLVFGLSTWLLTMLIFMPLAGAGLFALKIGMKVLLMILAMNVIFGVTMGELYAYDQEMLPGKGPHREHTSS